MANVTSFNAPAPKFGPQCIAREPVRVKGHIDGWYIVGCNQIDHAVHGDHYLYTLESVRDGRRIQAYERHVRNATIMIIDDPCTKPGLCPECKGKGYVELAISRVPCSLGCGQLTQAKLDAAMKIFGH